ncbi:MAG: hypothetical protein ABI700_04310 [Chloroflexota bacterium]
MTNDYDYDQAFQALLEQIQAYAPRACRLLETMKEQRSAYTAYHAAFVLVCLQARWKSLRKKQPMTPSELREFTFYEIAQGDGQVLALFDEILLCYQQERTIGQTALRRVAGARMERNVTDLKQKLLEIAKRLRRTARSTRGAAEQTPSSQARDHMEGVSDGLDLAANEIEAVLKTTSETETEDPTQPE